MAREAANEQRKPAAVGVETYKALGGSVFELKVFRVVLSLQVQVRQILVGLDLEAFQFGKIRIRLPFVVVTFFYYPPWRRRSAPWAVGFIQPRRPDSAWVRGEERVEGDARLGGLEGVGPQPGEQGVDVLPGEPRLEG